MILFVDTMRDMLQVRTGDTDRPRTAQSDYSQLYTMSSIGGESLQDIWQMLDDDANSPRPFTPQNIIGEVFVKITLF